MNRIWHTFCIISETGPDRFVQSEGGQEHVVRGVGNVRFQLSHGGYIDQDGVLFVPGMRVNLLSVSALEDIGYLTLFRRGHVYILLDSDDMGHVYIYSERAGLIDPQLIGDRFGEMYKFSAQPTVDESDKEQEAPEATLAPRVQS